MDVVIGIGGSSCMDMAKIIAFGVKNDNLWDYLSGKLSSSDREMLPVGEIPTFPSGGSEVDAAAEIDDFGKGVHGALVTFAQACSCYFGGTSKIVEGYVNSLQRQCI